MKSSLFQTIFLGIFGFAALVGLFVFATYSGKDGGADAIGAVVIWGTLPKEGMQSTLGAAAQLSEAFKSVSYVQKDPATLPSDIAIAIATGAAPDLILASQEELHSLTKFITPIPLSTLSVSTFANTFLDEGRLFTAPGGAGYYGMPFLVDPLVLFSNTSILSSNGIARPPATWEALTGLVPHVAVLTPARQITRGLIALGTYGNVRNSRGILSTLFLQQGVPMSSYSTTGVLTADLGEETSKGSPSGSAVLSFYTQFADPAKVSYTWNTSLSDSTQMFLSGDLALYLGYVSEARYLQAANPNLVFNVTPVPQSATAHAKGVYGRVYAFMIPRGAQNAAGAYQAAALLTGSAEQVAAAAATGLAPATLNELAKIPPADPVAAVSYPAALYSRGWLSPAAADVDRVFSGMIGNVIIGRSTPDAALGEAARSLSALLLQ